MSIALVKEYLRQFGRDQDVLELDASSSTVPLSETIEAFKRIAEGHYDDVPEQAFYNCGGIDDLERNAHELAKEA